MRLYVEFVKNAFQTTIAYRAEVLMRLFSRILFLFVQVSIWQALLGGTNGNATNSGIITVNDMITYAAISTVIPVIVDSKVVSRIDNKIRSGEIAMDLIKPMNFKGCIFCGTLGSLSFNLIFELIPVVALSLAFFGISYPSLEAFLIFVVSLINAYVLYFLLTYIIGLIAFWYITVWQLGLLFEFTVMFLSGAFIPLWFLPRFLTTVSLFFPFRLIYFAPISIYLGKVDIADALLLIVQQLFWIGILLVVERLLWSKGIKKLVVQGG